MLLEQLKQALQPLVELSRAESIVDVMGTEIHLRLLSPDEELACQQEAQQFISDFSEEDEVEDLSRTKAIRFLDGFRLAILSRAIVQINELDLRDLFYLETGEELKNGVKVKILKTQAVREIIVQFPRTIQVHIMQKFHILTESVNVVVEENLDTDFSDEDAEVQAMEEELQRKKNAVTNKKQQTEENDVRKLMRTTANQTESFVSERTNTAQDIENKSKEAFQKQEEMVEEPEPQQVAPPEEPIENTPQVRTPITPVSATPPSVGQPPPPPREPNPEDSLMVTRTKPATNSNIFQEQELPPRKVEPSGMQNGLEVYRLPTQEIGEHTTNQTTDTTTNSRNPRFRHPNK